MRRDFGLIRDILLQMEAIEGRLTAASIKIDRADADVINYHLRLMMDANLIEGQVSQELFSNGRPAHVVPSRMTWAGHDFLDAARDDTVWNRTLKKIGSRTASLTFELLKETLVAVARSMMGM